MWTSVQGWEGGGLPIWQVVEWRCRQNGSPGMPKRQVDVTPCGVRTYGSARWEFGTVFILCHNSLQGKDLGK